MKASPLRTLVTRKGPVKGFEGIRTVTGPMARSVEDIELFGRTIFGLQDTSTFNVAPVPYRDITLPTKLKFGYYTSGLLR